LAVADAAERGRVHPLSEIAKAEGITKPYMSPILRLALLRRIRREDPGEGADKCANDGEVERPLPASWTEQRRLIGGTF
jgi:hypothetical protein